MAQVETSRLDALDLLRGLAVAGMIVVTSPGDWASAYRPLQHAEWNGWTPADLIFPTFLFGVGMALGLSFPRPLSDRADRAIFWRRVLRRTLALIAIGLILNANALIANWLGAPPYAPEAHPGLRIPGVLQRIGLCYALASGVIVMTARRDADGRTAINPYAITVLIVAVLVLYWIVLGFVPVPGYGAGRIDQAGTWPAYVDRMIFTPHHMWELGSTGWRQPVTYDPEGLLSTLPATVNVLFGVLAARAWRHTPDQALRGIAIVGTALIALGLILDPVFVINKRVWTSSFALLSGGFSGLALVVLAMLITNSSIARLLSPLRILGGNAILAFAISILITSYWGVPLAGEGSITAQGWINSIMLGLIPDRYLASLACAFTILTLITLAIWPLHRRAIHFRV